MSKRPARTPLTDDLLLSKGRSNNAPLDMPPRDAVPAPVAGKRDRTSAINIAPKSPDVRRQLQVRAVQEQTTITAIVLRALHKDGFDIPEEELDDRRKR